MRVRRKMDLREITRHRTDRAELEMVQRLRAYYLIRGVIIQVVQEDATSGMSEVHFPGSFRQTAENLMLPDQIVAVMPS